MSESEVKKAIEILMAAGYSRPQASIVFVAVCEYVIKTHREYGSGREVFDA